MMLWCGKVLVRERRCRASERAGADVTWVVPDGAPRLEMLYILVCAVVSVGCMAAHSPADVLSNDAIYNCPTLSLEKKPGRAPAS